MTAWHTACLYRGMSTLTWSLYRPGSEVAFRAGVARGGYALAVSRDGVELVNEQTCDTGPASPVVGTAGVVPKARLHDDSSRRGCRARRRSVLGPGTPLPASAIAQPDPVPLSWDGWQSPGV